jgi:hypothetical protein
LTYRRLAILGSILICSAGVGVHAQRPIQGVTIAAPCNSGIYERGRCVDNPTPEQLRAREQEQAARAAREREFRRQVDIEVARLGEHRRAEAERFVRMRMRATEARGPVQPETSRVCTSRVFSQPFTSTASTRERAQSSIEASISRRTGCNITGSETITAMASVGVMQCSQRRVPAMTPPRVGDCLSCLSPELARSQGWTPERGWPAPPTEWVCTAPIQCSVERCEQSGRVTPQ